MKNFPATFLSFRGVVVSLVSIIFRQPLFLDIFGIRSLNLMGPISLVGVLELRFDLLHLLFLGQHRLGRFDLCKAGTLHHAAVDVHQRQAEPWAHRKCSVKVDSNNPHLSKGAIQSVLVSPSYPSYIHPGRLTWNVQITRLEGKMIWTKPPWLCSMLIFRGVVTRTPNLFWPVPKETASDPGPRTIWKSYGKESSVHGYHRKNKN